MNAHDLGLIVSLDEPVADFGPVVGRDAARSRALDALREQYRGQLDRRAYDDPARAWYHTAFVELFVFAYDTSFYDRHAGTYRIDALLDQARREFGGADVLVLWSSYPRLGIDHRNQFDCLRDLPGGLPGVRRLIGRCHDQGVRVLVPYMPWDEITRREGRPDGEVMADLLRESGADGLFLDTLASAAPEFRAAVERLNPAVVYDPEIMPKPPCASFAGGSWKQFQPTEPPLLPTIRWLEPRHTLRGIDRMTLDPSWQLAVNCFHGIGQVVWENVFGWWNPWREKPRALLRRCVRLLREHCDAFVDQDWQPYVATLADGVYAHRWHAGPKTVYTLLNTTERRIEGPILRVDAMTGRVASDAWAGEVVSAEPREGGVDLAFALAPRSVGCIVIKPVAAPAIQVIAEPTPDYLGLSKPGQLDEFPKWEHRRVTVAAFAPRPVAPTVPAAPGEAMPGMVLVPGGRYAMDVHHGTAQEIEGACYGDPATCPPNENLNQFKWHPTQYFWLAPYWIDATEVTNENYARFLAATRHRPAELTHFLRHWTRPAGREDAPWAWTLPDGKARHPVVWVDLDDARAYAAWAGKRLPREEEWQFAAQGSRTTGHDRPWPWGRVYDPARCNGDSPDTTPVDAFPSGASELGCLDLVGNVWEWTESERDDGHTRFAILKGGCHWRFAGSCWYTSCGAQPCHAHEKLPLMHPGLDRCATVGFRCVKDIAG